MSGIGGEVGGWCGRGGRERGGRGEWFGEHAALQPIQLFLRQNCGPGGILRPVQNRERERTHESRRARV